MSPQASELPDHLNAVLTVVHLRCTAGMHRTVPAAVAPNSDVEISQPAPTHL